MSVKIFSKILICLASITVLLAALPALAQNVTQAYSTDTVLRRGMIVGLNEENLRKVETVSSDQYERMHGVVVGSNDSALLLDSETETIYVATTGRFTVLVSDQNSNIAIGDYVTVSSVSGIGMKASSSDQIVLGRAIESFDGDDSNQVVSTATVKDAKNNEKQLRIGQILVGIDVSKNPLLKTDNSLPSILRKASELIAGHPVSSARVYIGLAVLAIASIISGSILYSAVRSGMIAVGRNPLGKKVIIKSLMQVVIISTIIFLSGVFGVYLLLKL
jgi:hypothetical protein